MGAKAVLPEDDDSRRNVVVIGGGFAGVTLARDLERRLPEPWDIYLLSKTNLITYNPLLPEVVGASVLPGHVVAPLRSILRRTRMRMVEVDGIDPDTQRVHYRNPLQGSVRYDHLVFACGVGADVSMVPGMQAHGMALKTLGDALHLRNQVIRRLEEATITLDPARREWLTNFVVVGGGFSGVEVAGEIQDLLIDAAPLFKRIDNHHCRVHVVHSGEHLLPELDPGLGAYAGALLTRRGVCLHLNERVASVDGEGVTLRGGARVEGGSIVCTIGTEPHPFVRALPQTDRRGRLVCDDTLRVVGTDNLWAIGDCAVVPRDADGNPSAPTAQFAVRHAHHLARNLCALLNGREPAPFRYAAIGQLAAIGHRKAVAQFGSVRLSGFVAWLMWRAFYLGRIPTLARKVRLFLEWNWALLFPKDVALLGFERSDTRNAPPEA